VFALNVTLTTDVLGIFHSVRVTHHLVVGKNGYFHAPLKYRALAITTLVLGGGV